MNTVKADIEAVSRLEAIQTILGVLRQSTGMRVALVTRITENSWTACAVLDDAGFGLKAGDELDLATTY